MQCGFLLCVRTQEIISPHTWAFSLIESVVDLCVNFNIPCGWPRPLQYPYWTSSSGAFFAFKTGPAKRKFRLWDTVLSLLIHFHKPFFSLQLCNQRVTLQLLFARAKYKWTMKPPFKHPTVFRHYQAGHSNSLNISKCKKDSTGPQHHTLFTHW